MASKRALRASREATLYANLDWAAEKIGIPNYVMDDVYAALTSGVNRSVQRPQDIITFADRFVTEGLLTALAVKVNLYCAGYEAWYPNLRMSREHWLELLQCLGLEHESFEHKDKPRWFRLDSGDQNFQIPPIDCGFVVRDPKKLTDIWSGIEIRPNLQAFMVNDDYWRPDIQKALGELGLQIAKKGDYEVMDLEDPRLQGHPVVVGTTLDPNSPWEQWMTVRDGTPELIGAVYSGKNPDQPSSAVPDRAILLAHK